MIGYIRILKNQIANEMQVNRHIKPSRKIDDGTYTIDPAIVSSKIKGLKRNTWIIFFIFMVSLYGQIAHTFWMAQIMILTISILLLINLYTNSHNIYNHQRWLNGQELTNKTEYFSLFKKKPIFFTLNAFFTHKGDR